MSAYSVLAYYHLSNLKDPHAEIKLHREFLEGLDVTCRIYISPHGINGQLSASCSDGEKYRQWMNGREEFKDLSFKIHSWHTHVFPRKSVKFRPQLVAMDQEIDFSLRGEALEPEEWRKMLEEKNGHLLLDVRNQYEWKVGHFKGADLPQCETFRDFVAYAEKLKETHDPEKTPVMMYCTGGIRCELYSSLLLKQGFKKVYQLKGGVIGYGLKEGSDHWLGKLFVFDDRLAIPISEEETPVVGKCHNCQTPIEHYYNCANMECNELFLSCPPCLEKYKGCCQESCSESPRTRPYHLQNPHKPFKKWYHYFEDKD